MGLKPYILKKIKWTFGPVPVIEILEDSKKSKINHKVFIGLFLFAVITNLIFINNELWQDELYTLTNFVFVPVSKTLLDYHSTNNHIVFNLICNFYLKILKIQNIEALQENPIIIRLVPYTFTLISVICFYYGLNKIYNSTFALLTISIYVTSIQLYTFGTQVRGYSLDLLFCIVLLNSLILYLKCFKKKYLFLLIFFGTLLLLNLPSTLYYFLSILIVIFIPSITFFKKLNFKINVNYHQLILLISLFICLLLFTIFFLFKFHQLNQNELLKYSGNSLIQLLKQPITVFYRFLDIRFTLLLFPILILFLNYIEGKIEIYIFFICLFILPFVFFAIHNPVIVLRIWIILLPVFSMLAAQISLPLVDKIKGLLYLHLISLLILCIISLFLLKNQTLKNHKYGFAALDLRYQYYLFNFNPQEIKTRASVLAHLNNAKIVLYDQSLTGIQYYIKNSSILNKNFLIKHEKCLILITDNSNIFNNIPLSDFLILDSGKSNQTHFFKWYLLKRAYD